MSRQSAANRTAARFRLDRLNPTSRRLVTALLADLWAADSAQLPASDFDGIEDAGLELLRDAGLVARWTNRKGREFWGLTAESLDRGRTP